MNTLPLFPGFPSVTEINAAIARGVKQGFRYAGSGPGAVSGIKPIAAVRELSGENSRLDPDRFCEVKFTLLGSESWVWMDRALVVAI